MKKTRTDPVERFWSKVEFTSTCWLWTAGRFKSDYGMFGVTAKEGWRAHRYAYELVRGPVPDGMELDHLCRVKHCVNPAHLEAVTHAENMGRRVFPPKPTRCPQNHPYDDENTWVDPKRSNTRHCRICARQHHREWEARRRA